MRRDWDSRTSDARAAVGPRLRHTRDAGLTYRTTPDLGGASVLAHALPLACSSIQPVLRRTAPCRHALGCAAVAESLNSAHVARFSSADV